MRSDIKQMLFCSAITLCLTLLPGAAQGSNLNLDSTQEVLSLDGVEDLTLAGGLTFEVICGATNDVRIITREPTAFKTRRRGNELSIKRKSLKQFLTLDRQDTRVHVVITSRGALPHLEFDTGVSGDVRTCLQSQPLMQLNVATGSKVRLFASDIGELSITASTGSDVEVVDVVSVRQLFLKLSTGSHFYGGPKFRATAARVMASTGSHANVCGADLVTGKAATGSSIRVSDQASVEIKSSITGGNIRQGAC